jgi:hypothetical protein
MQKSANMRRFFPVLGVRRLNIQEKRETGKLSKKGTVVYAQYLRDSFGNDIEEKVSLRAKRGNLTFVSLRME